MKHLDCARCDKKCNCARCDKKLDCARCDKKCNCARCNKKLDCARCDKKCNCARCDKKLDCARCNKNLDCARCDKKQLHFYMFLPGINSFHKKNATLTNSVFWKFINLWCDCFAAYLATSRNDNRLEESIALALIEVEILFLNAVRVPNPDSVEKDCNG